VLPAALRVLVMLDVIKAGELKESKKTEEIRSLIDFV
jgi:hypothetical protein